ncbi:hypothetical protein ACFVJ5_11540 [Nocardia sp. NPDC127606]|uniref:hypothetical protein n=1 Tax=Nocardia sp. NPDC127606 TaxID=3345406 RepID=UPI00362DBCD3
MTKVEIEILAALRPGGMLTLETMTKTIGRPKWVVRRAAKSLRRQALASENRAGQWEISGGRA